MPNYQAKCEKGHQFEAFQSFADYDRGDPLICPAHGLKGKRLISKPMVNGTSSFRLGHTEAQQRELELQLGCKVNSAKEVDEVCAKKGLAMVDKEWQPSSKIIKDREIAGLKKMEDALMKELAPHSEVIMPDGTSRSLGL